ncbi:MAG: hypothetical protein PHQ84_04480 [Candidatus Omnitrophica bacterium]|nr:hypothetical protein [Candidatus Omnitrophota bacterium]MDD5078244.1 hypothetical protein [Candidatus Omnitrophota bacterium]MDD5725095.1 hypothetical protein [Candidatus Omnitrophota bacterium]
MSSSGYVRMNGTGCLLPFLIIFNLFFGRRILASTGLWLGLEAFLIVIFLFRARIFLSGITKMMQGESGERRGPGRRDDVIDVQAQEVKEEDKR